MKLSRLFRHASLLLAAAALVSVAQAEDLSTKDKMFLQKAAQGGMTEVALGKLATEKAASPEVKAFGAMMVTDHTKAGDELKEVASKNGLTVAGKLNKKHAAMVGELSKLSGAAFDKAYVAGMVKGHEETVAMFEMAAKDATNPDVKAFAEKILPVIKMHLAKIQEIAKSI